MIQEIEKELLKKFPGLRSYFDVVFLWLEHAMQPGAIKIMAEQIGKTERGIVYSLLLGQLSAQIQSGSDVLAPYKKLVPVWEHVLKKLQEENYFTAKREKEIRAEMAPYLNGK